MNRATATIMASLASIAMQPALGAPAQTVAPTRASQPAGPAWQLVCPSNSAAATPAGQPCSLVQNLLAGEVKQRLLTVIIQRTPQAGHNMTVALPHGVLFPAGVSLQVDQTSEMRLVVQTSDQNGAYTGTLVDATLLARMQQGTTLTVGFTAGNGQRITVPVTLRDFGAGLVALDRSPLPAGSKPTPSRPG